MMRIFAHKTFRKIVVSNIWHKKLKQKHEHAQTTITCQMSSRKLFNTQNSQTNMYCFFTLKDFSNTRPCPLIMYWDVKVSLLFN